VGNLPKLGVAGIETGIENSSLYKKTEDLLNDYKSMQARVKNLELDIKKTFEWTPEETEEAIAGIAFRRSVNADTPVSGAVGDKTARVANGYWQEISKNATEVARDFMDEIGDAMGEKIRLERELAKIDNAIASLSEDEQNIIRMRYLEKQLWYEVAYHVQYTERHCKRLRTRAIWYMSKSIFGAGRVAS